MGFVVALEVKLMAVWEVVREVALEALGVVLKMVVRAALAALLTAAAGSSLNINIYTTVNLYSKGLSPYIDVI